MRWKKEDTRKEILKTRHLGTRKYLYNNVVNFLNSYGTK